MARCANRGRGFWTEGIIEYIGEKAAILADRLFSMRWFLADVLGLFSINVVPKQRMFSVPVIYVLGPLHIWKPAGLLLPCIVGLGRNGF